jgi:hypothetical protein
MKHWLHIAAVFASVVALSLFAARPAEARWLDLRAGLRGGGMVGWGATSNTPDFFGHTSGPGAGFEVGARLLIFDVSANHFQVFDSSGRAGTLTQFLLGLEFDVPLGDAKLPNGSSQNVFTPGLVGGFAFGTPGPVKPPLDNAQISDEGLVSHAKLAYEHFVNQFLGVGVEGDVGYHYFLGGKVIMNNQDHSSGYHLIGLATLTFHLGF